MRGTGYAIAEVIWWMLAAAVIGVAIGWVLHRWFGGGLGSRQKRDELEAKEARYVELSAELGEVKKEGHRLRTELSSKTDELVASQSEADGLTAQLAFAQAAEATIADRDSELGELAGKVADLEAELQQRTVALNELQAAHAGCAVAAEQQTGRVAGLEAELAERDRAIAKLEATATSDRPDTSRIADLEATLAGRDKRIVELEAAAAGGEQGSDGASPVGEIDTAPLAVAGDGSPPGSDIPAAAADASVVAWQSGVTAIGTAGAAHQDDLKVVNGIGPKLEGVLNGLGIQTWEQLAAMTADEVARLEEALEEFPGRIVRDKWVEQAKDLVVRYPDNETRPDKKALRDKSS